VKLNKLHPRSPAPRRPAQLRRFKGAKRGASARRPQATSGDNQPRCPELAAPRRQRWPGSCWWWGLAHRAGALPGGA